MFEQTMAVQRMQEYIEDHLDEGITPGDLARASLFSPWYSYRLFRKLTGRTPSEYVRLLRLSRSAMRLKKGECSVTDAAFDLGFGSVDGYTRAFRRAFGMNPGEYAKNPVPITLFVPYGVKFRESAKNDENRKDCEKMEKTNNIFLQVIRKPERKAIIKRGTKAADYFAYCDEVGCDVWGLLRSMDSLCGEPVCLWLPKKYRPEGTSEYVQGVEAEVSADVPVPEGFDVIMLPESEYLMFQSEPFEEENFMEVIENVQKAMNRYDPSVIGYRWDDENPRIQLEPLGERGYIELRAVKKIR